MTEPNDRIRLLYLADRFCNQEASDAELRELDALLVSSDEACRIYGRYLQLDSQLAHQVPSRAALRSFVADLPAATDDATGPASRSASPSGLWTGLAWQTHPVRFSLVALALTGACWLLFFTMWQPGATDRQDQALGPAQHRTVARLTATAGCRWATTAPPLFQGAYLQAGQVVELEAGLAEVAFHRGARIILEGPTRFIVSSEQGGALTLGRLTARVPEVASGFRVDTPKAVVVDLGTEFGLEVGQDGELGIQVYLGRVRLDVHDAQGKIARSVEQTPGPWLQLTAGQLVARSERDAVPDLVRQMPALDPSRVVPHSDPAPPNVAVQYHLDADGRDSAAGGLHLTALESAFTGESGPVGLSEAAGYFDRPAKCLRRQLNATETARFNTRQFTIEAWVKSPAPRPNTEALGVFQYRHNDQSRLELRLDSELRMMLAYQRSDDGLFKTVHTERPLAFAPGLWYHLAVTYERGARGNDGRVRFYQTPEGDITPNLIEVRANVADPQPLTAGGTLAIGGLDGMETRLWGGVIDEVRYVNRVLSHEELAPYQLNTPQPLVSPPQNQSSTGDQRPDSTASSNSSEN